MNTTFRRNLQQNGKTAIRIPNAAGETGRVARRTMLGDDGNQIGAHSALERLFSGIHFGMDDWGNWRLNSLHDGGEK